MVTVTTKDNKLIIKTDNETIELPDDLSRYKLFDTDKFICIQGILSNVRRLFKPEDLMPMSTKIFIETQGYMVFKFWNPSQSYISVHLHKSMPYFQQEAIVRNFAKVVQLYNQREIALFLSKDSSKTLPSAYIESYRIDFSLLKSNVDNILQQCKQLDLDITFKSLAKEPSSDTIDTAVQYYTYPYVRIKNLYRTLKDLDFILHVIYKLKSTKELIRYRFERVDVDVYDRTVKVSHPTTTKTFTFESPTVLLYLPEIIVALSDSFEVFKSVNFLDEILPCFV